MAKDIEEFLKMAAQRRREAAANAPAPPPQATPKKPPLSQQKKPAKPPVIVSEDENVPQQRRESVAKHVQKHLDTSRLQKRVQRLGAEVSKADDKIEARLHQKFDHDVGHLSGPSEAIAETAGQVRPPARINNPLLKMFSAPASVRQAVIMSEILKRPEWD
jgi:hypothetical protein